MFWFVCKLSHKAKGKQNVTWANRLGLRAGASSQRTERKNETMATEACIKGTSQHRHDLASGDGSEVAEDH